MTTLLLDHPYLTGLGVVLVFGLVSLLILLWLEI